MGSLDLGYQFPKPHIQMITSPKKSAQLLAIQATDQVKATASHLMYAVREIPTR